MANADRARRRHRTPRPRPRTSGRHAQRDALSSPRASCIGSASAAPGDTIAPARAMPNISSSIAWSRKSPGKPARRRKRCSSSNSPAGVAGRQIKRIPVAHLAGDAELQHQRFQPGDRVQAGPIGPRRALETIEFGQFRQRAVDFPQQHRGRGRGAAAAGQLAIDDDDVEALARQALGDQRSRDAGADDQRIAFEVLADLEADRMLARRKPRRVAAAQVGLFGIVCIENADRGPQGADAGANRRTPAPIA